MATATAATATAVDGHAFSGSAVEKNQMALPEGSTVFVFKGTVDATGQDSVDATGQDSDSESGVDVAPLKYSDWCSFDAADGKVPDATLLRDMYARMQDEPSREPSPRRDQASSTASSRSSSSSADQHFFNSEGSKLVMGRTVQVKRDVEDVILMLV